MTKSKMIVIKPEIHEKLDGMKTHPRETYGDVVERLVNKAQAQ